MCSGSDITTGVWLFVGFVFYESTGLLLFFSTHPLGFAALRGSHPWFGFVSVFSLQYSFSLGVGMLGLLGIFAYWHICLRR